MKKILILSILFTLLFIKIIAQNNLPAVFEIKTDTSEYVPLNDSNWQMLEDREGKWTINDVSNSTIADKFHLNTTKAKGIDYSINTLWFRYHFKNDMNHDARIAIPEDFTFT